MIFTANGSPPNGYCVICGKKLTEPGRIRHCSRSHRRKSYYRGPWMKFARKSREIVHDWRPYVAGRLRLDPEDPRLEAVTRRLAESGTLHAYVGVNNTVTAIGVPKET